MANPFVDMSQFTLAPNGTPIPNQFAPIFGLTPPTPPPPVAPLPTFTPEELAPPPAPPPAFNPRAPQLGGAPVPAAPPSAGTVPGPSAPAGAPEPPPLPAPPTLADATAGVDATIARVRDRQNNEAPRSAFDAAIGSLNDQRELARAGADLEAAQGRDEAAAYREQLRLDDEAQKARDIERDLWKREMDAARAELRSAQDAYTNHKVDQNKAWNDKSLGQKIMTAIGVAAAGLGGALVARDTGRPVTNPALDMVMADMEKSVRLQMADRDRLGQKIGMKRDAISDLRQRYSDDEAAFNALMAGNLRRVENQVKTIAATAKDPAAKLRLETFSAQIGMQAADKAQAAEDRELAQRNADRAYRMQAAGQALQQRQFDRSVLESDRNFAEGVRRFDIESGQRALEAAAKAAEAAAKKKGADDETARKEAEDIRDHGIGGWKSVKFNAQGLPEVSYEPFKQKDGSIFKASKLNAPKLQMKKASVDNLVQLIDDTVNLMSEHGHETDFAMSPAWQQMQANWGAMAIDEKTISELGVLAGPDMGLIAKKLGSGDPTQIRDTTPGLRKARQNTLDKFDKELRAHGYNGQRYNITEQTNAGVQDRVKNTPLQDTLATAQRTVKPGEDPFFTSKESVRLAGGIEKAPGTSIAPLRPEALASVYGTAALAKNGNQEARNMLERMGRSGDNPALRMAAREAAKRAGIEIAWPEEAK